MSDNNRDNNQDDDDVVFGDEVNEEREDSSLRDDGNDIAYSDIDDGDSDNEEGIFAAQPLRQNKKKSSSGLLGAVALLAVAGAGGYVYVSNPDLINQAKQNFLTGESQDITQAPIEMQVPQPEIVASTPDNAPSAVEIPSALPTPIPTPTPDSAAVPALDASSAAPEIVTTPDVVMLNDEGAADVSAPATLIENPASESSPAAVHEEPSVEKIVDDKPIETVTAPSEFPVTDTPPVAAPEKADVVALNEPPPSVEGSQSPVPVVEEAPVLEEKPPVEPPKAESPKVESPKVELPTAEIPVKSDSVKVETSPAPAPAETTLVASEKKTEAPVKETKPKSQPIVKADNITVKMSPEEQQRLADQKLDRYFEAPAGKLFKEVKAPSMNPKVGNNGSIIVVNKKAKASSGSFKTDSSSHVSFEKTNLDNDIVSAGRAVKLGMYDSAKDMYAALYKANPKDGRILMGRAVTFQKLGDTESAIAAYEDLLTIDPDNAEAIVNLTGLVRKTNPAVALNKLLDLRQSHPNNAVVAAQLGVAYADSGNLQDAYRYLSLASTLEPNNAQHYFNMAIVAEKSGNPQLAVENYEKALDADSVYGDGNSLQREKIYDRLAHLRGH